MSTMSSSSTAHERGKDAFERGAWKEAEAAFSEAIAADPENVHSWSNRALVYLKLQQPLLAWGDALHVCGHFDVYNVKILMRLAAAYTDMLMFDKAIEMYQQCIIQIPLEDTAARVEIVQRARQVFEARQAAFAGKDVAKDAATDDAASEDAAAVQARIKQARLLNVQGLVTMPTAYRGEEGGPRDPAIITKAFSFTTGKVELKLSPSGKGMSVVATQDIPSCTLIHVDTPLLAASIPCSDEEKDCYHCTRPVGRKDCVPCACDRVYCSEECKEAAWETYHEPLCSMAGGAAVTELENACKEGTSASSRYPLLMWKMLGAALLHSKRTGEPLKRPADVPPFCHLWRLTDLSDPDGESSAAQPTAMFFQRNWLLMRLLLSEKIKAMPALSIRWICDAVVLLGPNVMCLHGTGRTSFTTYGSALMSAGTFFNHSCEPNVSERSHTDTWGSKVRFVTARHVKKGEELTISYCDDGPECYLRLKGQYGITCNCAKCARGAKDV